MPGSVRLPWRERLMAEGIEFTRYFTHSSPCSPSRASLLTGRYLPGHGVVDNVIMPEHKELDPSTPTLGSLLRGAGYRSSYIGKWHCRSPSTPTWRATGTRTGTATTGTSWGGPGPASTSTRSSPPTPRSGCAPTPPRVRADPRPWFLTVALVNPHDVMWFPSTSLDTKSATPRTWPRCAGCSSRRLEGRRRAAGVPLRLRGGGGRAPRQLPRRPAHQARGAPAVALGPAARAVGLHRPRRHEGRGSGTSTITSKLQRFADRAWGRCWPLWRKSGSGTTPW